ncbi:MAG: hypothetical protein JNL70_12425 [Saprospiraceae bacterium]|nr:hypothetical protein [Saprospiraceae bacterium]
MIFLILSILFSVLLLVNFRLHPKYGIDTTQAIVFNYWVCVALGWLLLPTGSTFSIDWSADMTYYSLLLGLGFIVVFMLSGASTLKSGIAVTSLANNMSLVIPVLFNLWVFKTSQNFGAVNYIGLVLAFVAVYLSTTKENADNTPQERKNWLLPLLVFLMYGITNTSFNYLNFKYVSTNGSTIAFMVTACLGAVVSGLFLLLYHRKRIEFKNIIAAIPLGIPNFLSFYFLLKALDEFKNNGAYVLPIYNIGVILASTAVALFFFKERLSKLNWTGLALAVVAIIFISWR